MTDPDTKKLGEDPADIAKTYNGSSQPARFKIPGLLIEVEALHLKLEREY